MTRSGCGVLATGLVWLASSASFLVQAAEAVQVSVANAAPPQELAEPIRNALAPKVVRLSEKEQPFYEFWFRTEIPLAEKPPAEGLPPTVMREGTLVGAVKVLKQRFDFKDLEIPPGIYVLRFGLQPEDGNHQGTSPTRTFVLLLPAKDDKDLNAFTDHDPMVKASSAISPDEHPVTLSLQPVKEKGEEFPRLAAHEGGKFKLLYLRLPANMEDRTQHVSLTLGLVYEGHGQK